MGIVGWASGQPHRRAVGQGNINRLHAHVAGRRAQHGGLSRFLLREPVGGRVFVETAAVAFNGIPHRRRMRGQQEAGHVNPVAFEEKLIADGLPRVELERRHGLGGGEGFRKCSGQQAGAQRQAGADEKLAAVQAFHEFTLLRG